MLQYRIKGYVLLEGTTKKDIKSLRELFAGAMQSLVNFNLLKYKKKRKISYMFKEVVNKKHPEWVSAIKYMVGNKHLKKGK